MRLNCPSCAAEYEIETDVIGRRGRKMRCSACNHEWFQSGASLSVADAAAAIDQAAKQRSRPAERETVLPPDPRPTPPRPEPETVDEEAEEIRFDIPKPARPDAGFNDIDTNPDPSPTAHRDEKEPEEETGSAGRAFFAGFGTVTLIAMILAALYVKRTDIVTVVPDAAEPLALFAEFVDRARETLQGFIKG